MRALVLMLLIACGGATPASPVAWWQGHWAGASGSEEHWIAAGDVLYGIGLAGDSFELMIVDDHDGWRFSAMPGGAAPVVFRATLPFAGTRAVFTNPAHDDPKSIRYERRDDTLTATVDGTQTLVFAFTRASAVPAPDVEALDRTAGKRVLASGQRGMFAYTVGTSPQRSYATIWKRSNNGWTIAFEASRPIRGR